MQWIKHAFRRLAGTPVDDNPHLTGPPRRTRPADLSAAELRVMLDSTDKPFLLDVREPVEKAAMDIGGLLVPLGELAARLKVLETHKSDPVVVYCRSGVRSRRAAAYLADQGFERVYNLKGGVLAWIREVDRSGSR